jgi:hypothetical protein
MFGTPEAGASTLKGVVALFDTSLIQTLSVGGDW